MRLQISVVSRGSKEDTKGNMRIIGFKPQTSEIFVYVNSMQTVHISGIEIRGAL